MFCFFLKNNLLNFGQEFGVGFPVARRACKDLRSNSGVGPPAECSLFFVTIV